jgi:hypothetical protein
MNSLTDEIFNTALEQLAAGKGPRQIAQQLAGNSPELQQELESLLAISALGMQIPKLEVPAPHKRHLYAETLNRGFRFAELLPFVRLAIVPLGLALVFFGGHAGVSATQDSLPGDLLYSVKRASESARLSLTRDSEKVASLHVEFMQNRLDEVKQAADSGDPAAETAAIAELKTQTERTFAEAAPVATAQALAGENSSLLDSLVAVNKEQKTLLTDISASAVTNDAKLSASSILEDNKKNELALASIIATINNQALMALPNKVSVTGEVTGHSGSYITVEKNSFSINDQTSFLMPDGQATTETAKISGRVTVTGVKTDSGQLIAKQIMLLTEVGTPEVKGVATPAAGSPTTASQPAATTAPPAEPTPTPHEPEDKATGGYIVEPASPQYTP